jgi:hypothetical protein
MAHSVARRRITAVKGRAAGPESLFWKKFPEGHTGDRGHAGRLPAGGLPWGAPNDRAPRGAAGPSLIRLQCRRAGRAKLFALLPEIARSQGRHTEIPSAHA